MNWYDYFALLNWLGFVVCIYIFAIKSEHPQKGAFVLCFTGFALYLLLAILATAFGIRLTAFGIRLI
ncbi:hypothetical protein ABEP12_01945 [Bacillus velezensis]